MQLDYYFPYEDRGVIYFLVEGVAGIEIFTDGIKSKINFRPTTRPKQLSDLVYILDKFLESLV